MPFTKPTKLPEFCTNGIAVEEPIGAKKIAGWEENEAPPFNWFNWLHNLYYNWIGWLDQYTQAIKAELETVESYTDGLDARIGVSEGKITTLQTEVETANTGLLDLVKKALTGLIPRVTVLEGYAPSAVETLVMGFIVNNLSPNNFSLKKQKVGLITFLHFPAETFTLGFSGPEFWLIGAAGSASGFPASGTFIMTMILGGHERHVQVTISIVETNRLKFTFMGSGVAPDNVVTYNVGIIPVGTTGFSAQTVVITSLS